MTGKTLLGTGLVIATEHPLASTAALRTFEDGGNAYDAAVSASFVLSVVQPQLSGLGGDFFGLFHDSKGGVKCLNASGWSPSSVTPELMKEKGWSVVPTFGYASVVVPGYVAGICEVQKRYGRLGLDDCMGRAIELAEEGFALGPGLVGALGRFGSEISPAARKTFMSSEDVPLVGSVVKQPQLARTLRDISEGGAEEFYSGRAGAGIREVMSAGGFEVDEDDLAEYSPEWCEPLQMDYRGTDVFEVPPNSMGATSLLMLRLLEEHNMTSLKPNSAERVKVMVEAAKAAYAARDKYVGDPRFAAFELGKFLRSKRVEPVQKKIDRADTTYFAVADGEGNVLSCIQSIFHNFGSRVFVEEGGFFMNNRGSAFRMEGPNKLGPRKRPLHTLSALILSRDGKPYVAVGASGGDYRPQQHALFATNIIDYGMDVDKAIDYPRFLWDGANEVLVEEGYRGLDRLRLRHRSVGYPGPTGVGQGVQVMTECLKGACDIRGEGLPAGA